MTSIAWRKDGSANNGVGRPSRPDFLASALMSPRAVIAGCAAERQKRQDFP